MCSNYELTRERLEDAKEQFNLTRVLFADLKDESGYYPKRTIPIIGATSAGVRLMTPARWGLVPNFYNSATQQPQPFNARSDKITVYEMYRECFEQRRCIVPAVAFFEYTRWTPKVRYRLSLTDGALMGFAGLYDVWRGDDGAQLVSATMVTHDPNDLIGRFHDRMPVILSADQYAAWLDIETPIADLIGMLTSYPSDQMVCAEAPKPKTAPRQRKQTTPDLFGGDDTA